MPNIRAFTVAPSLPEKLQDLETLAYNLRWTWDHETIDLFRRLDRELWKKCYQNPVLMLGKINQERLRAVATDDGFIAHMERASQSLRNYMQGETWYQKINGRPKKFCIAYFSAEFGLTESMPIYSGGLGILSGDHLKSASELGLPLVGVGLLYQEGYFRQYLNADGWQQESYPTNDFYNLPLTLERREDGRPITVTVDLPGRAVVIQVWRAQVGRVSLYLLDTNVPDNSREDQDITDELYGGDAEMRVKQEIVLGIGGLHALDALGLEPDVCHMNEGHSAFLGLERIRKLMRENGFSFTEAHEAAAAGNVFTTHTPVPAGIDIFAPHLIETYFAHYYPALELTREQFMALGRQDPRDRGAGFNMAVLALRLSSRFNGVSQLHGKVARRMWQNMWLDLPVDEVPIEAITNGIHARSWISKDMAGLFDRYLGPRWVSEPTDQTVWQWVDRIPDEELWRTHERRRERLVAFARRRLAKQLAHRGASPSEVALAAGVLNPDALTIGFARRFATYKRATLIFRDPERLARLLCNRERPVQIIFTGKAHPRDDQGKALIKEIIHHAHREEFRQNVVFIEDYDINVARYLVEGVDVWLNTPRRPREASGTSGMKAAANGVLNLSVLDGWWAEAYGPDVGWAIGRGEEYEDLEYQNEVESAALYNLLEKDVAPLFYARGRDKLPFGWIAKMKASMRTLCPVFNTNRMVREYAERFYLPAGERFRHIMDQDAVGVRALAAWKQHLFQHWHRIRVQEVEADGDTLKVGDVLHVRAQIYLGELTDQDVEVEIYYGMVDDKGGIPEGIPATMRVQGEKDDVYTFAGVIPCLSSGRFGYALRVLPRHQDMLHFYELGLVLWG
jgi:starch phosphorylase